MTTDNIITVASIPLSVSSRSMGNGSFSICLDELYFEIKRKKKFAKIHCTVATSLLESYNISTCKFRPIHISEYDRRRNKMNHNIGICIDHPILQLHLLTDDILSEITMSLREILIDAMRCLDESKELNKINIKSRLLSEIDITNPDNNTVVAKNELSKNAAFSFMKIQKSIGTSIQTEFDTLASVNISPRGSYFIPDKNFEKATPNVEFDGYRGTHKKIALINKGGSKIKLPPIINAFFNRNDHLLVPIICEFHKLKNKKLPTLRADISIVKISSGNTFHREFILNGFLSAEEILNSIEIQTDLNYGDP